MIFQNIDLKFTPTGKITKKSRLELEQSGLKWCARCDQIKSLKADFYHPASLKGKPQSNCVQCIAQIEKEYKKTDKGREKRRRNWAKYWAKHKDDPMSCVRFTRAEASATRNGKSWDLLPDEYVNLIMQNCMYCNHNVGTGTGLDRINNDLGYIIDNVVPCCEECNTARMNNFTHEEMKIHIGPAIRLVKLSRVETA